MSLTSCCNSVLEANIPSELKLEDMAGAEIGADVIGAPSTVGLAISASCACDCPPAQPPPLAG